MTELQHHKTGEIENFPELIDLQSAHMTQHTTDGHTKTDWSVEKNITNEQIFVMPKRLTDKEVFAFMNFAKKYELIAFNKGISFQKDRQNELLVATIKELQINNKGLAEENIRLASILENLLPEGE